MQYTTKLSSRTVADGAARDGTVRRCWWWNSGWSLPGAKRFGRRILGSGRPDENSAP